MADVDDGAGWALIAEERHALADVLDTLSPADWDTPSLCGAWTVKGVAIHLMVGPTGSLTGFLTAMAAARGRFERANDILVQRRINRTTEQVVADLRENADSRFAPPGFGWIAPFTDLLVHRLDMLVPLDVDAQRSPDLWQPALDFLVSRKATRGFRPKGLPQVTLAATDTEWQAGSGPVVTGPAAAIGLAIMGRDVWTDQLGGPGAAALTRWAQRGGS